MINTELLLNITQVFKIIIDLTASVAACFLVYVVIKDLILR